MSIYSILTGGPKAGADRLMKILELDSYSGNSKNLPPIPRTDLGYVNNKDPDYHKVIQAWVDSKAWISGRFRDIYVVDDNIVLYTRNGAGNREEFCFVFDILCKHPNYVGNKDDEDDPSYAKIYFNIPMRYKSEVLAMATPGEMHGFDRLRANINHIIDVI